MTTTTMNPFVFATSASASAAKRSSLLRLYLVRGLLALIWAAVFAKVHEPLGGPAVTLLVIYPLIDATSSLIDYRTMRRHAADRITAFNAVLSAIAAIGMGVTGGFGVAAALAAFGVWAVVSGAAQVLLGVRRRGHELGRQWPMLIAGGLSFLVGISYVARAFGDRPSLAVLAVYATGGGAFFVIQAGLLAWRSRQRRHATP